VVSGAATVEAKDQPRASDSRSFDWADVLWREWRRSEDESYAAHLFDLVAGTALGWTGTVMIVLFSTLYGLLAGYLLGLVALNLNAGSGDWVLSGRQPLLLAWLMGIGGGLAGIVISRWLSWRVWLGLATPEVFGGRIGALARFNAALVAGLIAGFVGLSPFVIGLMLIIFMVVGNRLGMKLAAREQGLIWIMAAAAGVGIFLSGVIVQGQWLGLGVGLGLGVWLGLTWGSALVGVAASWLGLLGALFIFGPTAWLVGWLGLSTGFGLGLVPILAGNGIEKEEAYPYRGWYFWWRKQPAMADVARALQAAVARQPKARELWAEPLRRLARPQPAREPVGVLVDDLKSPDWVERLTARQALIELGGEAAEALAKLNDGPLEETAMWLLGSIEQETRRQLAWRAPLIRCPTCLARFGPRSVNVSLGVSFVYFGCRVCSQSRDFLECPAGVTAVLDTGWTESRRYQDGRLYINWLLERRVFDFDRVEIIRAADEDVERLAVQVGNDTDPARRSHYPEIPCWVAPECRLSENTLRILSRMFGAVKHG
jgi:hypothetical protein